MTAQEFLPLLEQFITTQEEINGYWNGEDTHYIGADGEAYDEDDAHVAHDRAEAAKKLRDTITQDDL